MTAPATPARQPTVLPPPGQGVSDHPSEPGTGVTVSDFLGAGEGATQLSIALVDLAPGAEVRGHVHPFEESFYVLSGAALVRIGGQTFDLVADDFGLVPAAVGHAWANRSERPARLLRVHAPQPRPINGQAACGVYAAPDIEVPTSGQAVSEVHPRHQLVGHFAESDMAPPGSISMPGYHGPNIQNVQIRMMVDELLGARHHTMFIVQFSPNPTPGLSAKEHYHPFEEAYLFVRGSALGSFDGARVPVNTGDLVFAPAAASHGFTATGTGPVRWIEVQSPLPPASHGFVFHHDWSVMEPLG
jgi:mannose-6-phosphate isomerase-like protein (cupin superfamily)